MNNHLGILIVLIGVYVGIFIGASVSFTKTQPPPQNEIISFYTHDDIMHVWPSKNKVEFESGVEPLQFQSYQQMTEWIESYTADTNTYLTQLESDIWNGNLRVELYPTIDGNCNTTATIGEAVVKFFNKEVATFTKVDTFSLKCGEDKVFSKITLWSED